MTSPHEMPVLLAPPVVPAGDSDQFIETLIETARRNIDRPATAIAVAPTQIVAAGGWCAPPPPEGSSPELAYEVLRPSVAEDVPALAEQLACGCSVDVLETGSHLPGCAVLNIPSEVSDPEEVTATRAGVDHE